MKVIMRDIRAAHCCSRGARAWFERHGLDWSSFLRVGVEPEKVLATGCPLGERVVACARNRAK